MTKPLLAIILASLISALVAVVSILVYRKIGWLDDPKKNNRVKDTHTEPVPRGGGNAIFFSILICALLFINPDKHLIGILCGAGIVWVMGFLDDRFNISPYVRLFGCLLAGAIVAGSGIGISFVTNPFGGIIKLDQPRLYFNLFGKIRSIWLIADIFSIIWITFLINTVNWAKGFDGQLPGIAAISALTIAALSLNFSADVTQWPVTILALIVAGAYLGFLPFNFYPQRIMPGYGGGGLAGYFLAVLSILSTAKVGTIIVVLGVPIIDAFYSIIRRLAKGKSPVWGDRGHLHHHILDKWHWGKRRTAVFYWASTAVLGLLALNLNAAGKFYTMVMLLVLLGVLFLWFSYSSKSSNRPDQDNR